MNRFKKAELAQSACNLAGLANSLIEMVREVHAEGGDVREDPAVRLLVHQMAFLTIGEPNWDYVKAYDACCRRAPMTDSQLKFELVMDAQMAQGVVTDAIRNSPDLTADQIARALRDGRREVQLAALERVPPTDIKQLAQCALSGGAAVEYKSQMMLVLGEWNDATLERAGIVVEESADADAPDATAARWYWRDTQAPGGDQAGEWHFTKQAATFAALNDHWPVRDWATEVVNEQTTAPYADWVNERVDEVLTHRAATAKSASGLRLSA